MTIISIDFSILYPGVCICKDFKEYQWVSVVNSNTTKKHRANLEDLVLKYPSISIAYTESKRRKDEQYHVTERIKLHNYFEATDLLISEIEKVVDKTDDLLIAIEGISFGSKGNALVDIAQATGIIKNKLIDTFLNGDVSRFFVFSPGELKNAIGCKGNAPKGDIFAAFKEDPIIASVKDSELYRAVLEEDWMVTNKGDIVSPIMDMIDAYLGVTKIHGILNQK
jgi:Holliday junction resolvasome RuvABC endonuclease subunit